MSSVSTEVIVKAYVEELGQRAGFGQYFAPEVSLSMMGSDVGARGAAEVEQFIRYFHEQAFDAQPVPKTMCFAEGRAALEFSFIAVHTGEFMGVAATGRHVDVPYSVVYDLDGDRIAALRVYMPMDTLMRQLGVGEAAPAAAS
jgi:ketosteroid isomerase-like protein